MLYDGSRGPDTLVPRWLENARLMESPARANDAVLDDPWALKIVRTVEDGSTSEKAVQRLRQEVHDIVQRKMRRGDRNRTRAIFGPLLGLGGYPLAMQRNNPYGVAFSLARRRQLLLDGVDVVGAINAVNEASLGSARAKSFGPGTSRAAVVSVAP